MKRITALAMISILAFGLMTGCGKSEQPEAEVETEPVEESVEVTDADVEETVEQADVQEEESAEGVDFTSYTVMDLDLNEVELADYISENKVTMINLWGTFCGPCVLEMPELGNLERKYRDQGFEIIGLTSDICDMSGNVSADTIADAREIMDYTKITYPVLICTPEIMYDVELQYIPTTYFVDSQGNILREVEVGARDGEYWEGIITELLSETD